MIKKLHPNSRPKREKPSHFEFANLYELCINVVQSEGWSRHLEVERVPGSRIVQVLQQVHTPAEDTYDPQIVFSSSEDDFDRGEVSRAMIRAECREFFVD